MKIRFPRPIILSFLAITLSACNLTKHDSANNPKGQPTDSLGHFLQTNLGKYPRDIRLLEQPTLEKRLKKLVGTKNYKFIIKYFQTQTPLDTGNDYGHPELIMTQGFETHNAATNYIILAYNPKTDNIAVKIVRDSITQIFQEQEGGDTF